MKNSIGRTMRSELHPRTIARYRGECVRCGEFFDAGAKIAAYDELGGWSHVVCPAKWKEADLTEHVARLPKTPLFQRLAALQKEATDS